VPSDNELLLGKIILEKGFCTQAHIDRCLAIQAARHDGTPLGRVLVSEGFITEEQHSEALAIQRRNMSAVDPLLKKQKESVLFGKLAVREGLISEEEANKCLRQQALEGEKRSLGEIMVAKGCLTSEQVKDLLSKQQKRIMSCPVCRLCFTVLTISKGKKIACPRCKGPLVEGKPSDSTRTDAEFATKVLRAAKREVPPGSMAESRVIRPEAVQVEAVCLICDQPFFGYLDSTGRARCPSCHATFVPK
jgi:DNA-directed RNA polymerase subunit RPC12/RpoP